MAYYAERLSDWIVNLRFKDIPTDVVERAKLCISDWASITILGSYAPWSEVLVDIVREIGGKEESTIARFGDRVPCMNAAMVNATMALSHDFSDTYIEAELHPSCAVIAAALAMAERERASGEELITSVVVGYEIMSRVGEALNKAPHAFATVRGYCPIGVISPFGAVAAAGKLLDLDKEQTANAIGLAGGSMGGGLIEYLLDGDWTYRWNAGRPTYNAILNALMAKRGFLGPRAIFEGHWDDKGRYGIIKAYAEDLRYSEKLVEGLGDKWNMRNLGFKYYACCHFIHGYIDGIIKLMARYPDIEPEQIEEIIAIVPHMALFLGKPRQIKIRPPNLTVAQWSLPFCLATVILDGHLLNPIQQLSQERLNDQKVLELAAKIQVERDRKLDETFEEEHILRAPLQVKLTNGKQYEITSPAKGFSENPMTEEEFENKFRQLASMALSEQKVEKLRDVLTTLEKVDDICELTQLLAAQGD